MNLSIHHSITFHHSATISHNNISIQPVGTSASQRTIHTIPSTIYRPASHPPPIGRDVQLHCNNSTESSISHTDSTYLPPQLANKHIIFLRFHFNGGFFWFWENLSFCTRRSVNGCNPAAYFGGKIIEYFVNRLVYWKERNGSVSEILMEEYWSETIPKRIMEGESSVDWGRWELGIDMVWGMGMVLKVVVANFILDNDGAETMVEEFGQWFWIL